MQTHYLANQHCWTGTERLFSFIGQFLGLGEIGERAETQHPLGRQWEPYSE